MMIMNGKMKFILFALLAVVSASCTRNENVPEEALREKMTFVAHTEGYGDNTKTTLGGEVGDEMRYIQWDANDTIGIASGYEFSPFANTLTERSETALFEGYVSSANTYYALFPYGKDFRNYTSTPSVSFSLPAVQEYVAGSFGKSSFPMVAKKSADEDFQFKNLCGILLLRMRGDFIVKSVTFEAKDSLGSSMSVSGSASVNLSNMDSLLLVMSQDGGKSVTIDCGEGVELSAEADTPFHLVLPPATYHTFKITVATTDGGIYIKEGTKPLTITRSVATKSGSFTPEEIECIYLCENGTANSYIVSESGGYSINASVIGNGPLGLAEGGRYHTSNVLISPVKAELLWEDNVGLVSAVSFDQDTQRIQFMTTGRKGNALVAAMDEEGTILWSWHIWCTDEPVIHKYVNSAGTFEVMDRNLGAIRGDRGVDDQWQESCGLDYNRGRKDPFAGGLVVDGSGLSLEETIKFPTHRLNGGNTQGWLSTHKTIYDPCPAGYRVAPYDIWCDFSIEKVSGEFDHGWNFQYDEDGNAAWYPTRGYPTANGVNYWGDNYMLSSSVDGYSYPGLYFSSGTVYQNNNSSSGPLRCMKDDSLDTSLPVVVLKEITDITANSLKIKSVILTSGDSDVTERGVVYGESEDVNMDSGVVVKSGSGSGEYETILSDLSPATRYYARAYATNSEGTYMTPAFKLETAYADADVEDLSQYGTANSYIVSRAGYYKFKATQGRSQDRLYNASYAEVLWESFGTDLKPTAGDLISDVEYSDGYVSFNAKYDKGNAVVAVMDADSTILWSWHIWLTDQPAEQIYPNNAGVMMDRNLGATSAIPGDVKSLGLFYQWGRKDPFLGARSIDSQNFANSTGVWPSYVTSDAIYGTVEYATQNPTQFISSNSLNQEWLYTGSEANDTSLWGSDKTIYDPCPLGWRVPDGGKNGVWNVSGFGDLDLEFDTENKGYHIPLSDNGLTAWYPASGYYEYNWPRVYDIGSYGHYWSATHLEDEQSANYLYFTTWDITTVFTYYSAGTRGHTVRCIKEDSYITDNQPAVVINNISEVTSNTITVSANVRTSGYDSVVDRGIIYGVVSDITLDNGSVIRCGTGTGVYDTVITNLSSSSVYYIKAYATNSFGTSYSDEKIVTTLGDGVVTDLSAKGRANSYIVSEAGKYSFHANLKGNSDEFVTGVPASAELLWETHNITEEVVSGSVVSSVSLSDGKVVFTVPDNYVSGNALIAVKDADGVVLWSWHIWVTDYDPETQNHKYPSGAVLMDRNLGALTAEQEIRAGGLLYQWGRKDPFMSLGDESAVLPASTSPAEVFQYVYIDQTDGNVEYAIKNPTEIIYSDGEDWLAQSDATLWSSRKTKYDPCPEGWQVPTLCGEVWDGDTLNVYYPQYRYSISDVNMSLGYSYWTSQTYQYNASNAIVKGAMYHYKSNAHYVRCMMIPRAGISSVSQVATDEDVTLTLNLTSDGAQRVLEHGVVWSDQSGRSMVITNLDLNVYKEADSDHTFGERTIKVVGLASSMTYYFRPYIITERGISYGEIVAVTTQPKGDNENFGDEDYEW